jgi:integrase
MAYLRKLPSGKWQATVRHPAGHKLTKTDPLKRAVQAWAADMEAGFRNGEVSSERGRNLTVQQWHDKWIASRNVEKATSAKNESQLRRHILPQWGSWPLRSIGRNDVQAWVTSMVRSGVGAPTVTSSYNLFSALMSDAALEGTVPASPCREIDLPKIVKPEPRWLTRHEYDRLQLALAGMPRAEVWQAYVALGCLSGLRPGELAGLDVPALDFDRGIVYVSQVVTRYGLKPYGKTSASTRWVPFPDEAATLLWRLVADRSQGPVFTSPTGRRINEANFRNRVWRPALEAAGVPQVDVYTMRHTAASWWVQQGVPDYEVAQALGHSSTRMVSTYAHLDPRRHQGIRAAWAKDVALTTDNPVGAVGSGA